MDSLNDPPLKPCEKPCILVTGGAGYIGSNTVLELLLRGQQGELDDSTEGKAKLAWEVVVVDNLRSSKIDALIQAQQIARKKIHAFHKIDLLDKDALDKVFRLHPNIWGIIHFASAKSVAESLVNPLLYYNLNIGITLNLLNCVVESKKNIAFVFSSSACVYGSSLDEQQYDLNGADGAQGVTETCSTKPKSPYGRTKLYIEEIIRDVCYTQTKQHGVVLRSAILRYFNPVGAHSSGHLGEYNGTQEPANLVPIVTRLARRVKRAQATICHKSPFVKPFKIFGGDWPTPDGSPIRDFLHITDLAKSHVCALEFLTEVNQAITSTLEPWNCWTYNIGCGRGYSVKQVVEMVEKISGVQIPVEIHERRDGDVGIAISDSSKAEAELNWTTQKSLEDMCRDAWKFEMKYLEPLDEELWRLELIQLPVNDTTVSDDNNSLFAVAAEQ
ncbi:UDP-glucose 4-epimerase [Rhizoclosmatium globosum]|uniref:UDP-glucose 4-epimerase n=1 Tax=Rhizoclosmatium globosum TaxID=329046 RepID=A0A1Y2CQ03_9FUNG|nr:UDP-glucose 4-epimerase [Rhizoclosmatium globosum]|eukprot:ORY49063.1 UDP-glucose 4-epimerase [Rhizoclosmatium globosum]